MAHDPKDCMFSSIDAFIETLESITNSWDEMFKALQDKALTQEQFNENKGDYYERNHQTAPPAEIRPCL